MAPSIDEFHERAQDAYSKCDRFNLSLGSFEFTTNGTSEGAQGCGKTLGLENTSAQRLISLSVSKLPPEDQASYAQTPGLHKPNVWECFLHLTVATIFAQAKLPELQERLVQDGFLGDCLHGPLSCTPVKLRSKRGKSERDRDKVILHVEFDTPSYERLKLLTEAIGARAQALGIPVQMKLKAPHIILSKRYAEDKSLARPDQDFLDRICEAMKKMDTKITFHSLTLAAAGSELGYLVAPSMPVIAKYPVKTWQLFDGSLPADDKLLWVPGYDEAEHMKQALQHFPGNASEFLQGIMNVKNGAKAENSQVQEAAESCCCMQASTKLPEPKEARSWALSKDKGSFAPPKAKPAKLPQGARRFEQASWRS